METYVDYLPTFFTGKLLKEIVAGALLRILKKRWRAILFVAFCGSVYIKTRIY